MYYQSSENNGADQLQGYRKADLRLCFCICKKHVFSWHGPNLLFGVIYEPRREKTGFMFMQKQRRRSGYREADLCLIWHMQKAGFLKMRLLC